MGNQRKALQEALGRIEAELAAGGGRLALRVERAGLLAALGRVEPAKQAYLEILHEDPTHYETLNNLGALLSRTGYRTAARTVFEQAVRRHPAQPAAHVNLANLLLYADELALARTHYEAALRLDPGDARAHQGLSALLHETGEHEAMRLHRRLGFGAEPVSALPYLGDADPAALLVLTSTPGADIAWPKLVDEQHFAVTTLAAAFFDPLAALPAHDLVLNAIGDADLAGEDLQAAEVILARSGARVVNPPAKVMATGRAANARRLGELAGVRAPRIALMDRAALEGSGAEGALAGHGLGFPILLRSPGFHMGRHFVEAGDPQALRAAVAALPGEQIMAIERLDARGADGFVRKYRMMIIGGRLHPLHLAVSRDWRVHYFSAAMHEARFRDEEARYLEAAPTALGARAMAALGAIGDALGLDYAGVDFGIGPQGELLLFEANAVMNLIAPDPSPEWDYRRPAVDRALSAARAMLVEAADVGRAARPDS